MRALLPAMWLGCITLQAGILPTYHREPATLKIFQDYTAEFERTVSAQFQNAGTLWIDSSGKRKQFDSGRPVIEARRNEDVPNGSIHHFSGSIRVEGAAIEDARRVMQDYGNYPKYFKPDVTSGHGTPQPDSTPADEHFHNALTLAQSTLWIDVTYDSVYDTHYRRLDKNRWMSRSVSLNVKERIDPKDPGKGYYPEGDDHGFLWRTHTYWLVRERSGGLDMQVDSITISRPVPTGFGWWGTRRTRDAVTKMVTDMKAAIESLR